MDFSRARIAPVWESISITSSHLYLNDSDFYDELYFVAAFGIGKSRS